jgi:archaeal flagellar protein FlaJ
LHLRDLHYKRPLLYGIAVVVSTLLGSLVIVANAYMGVTYPFPVTTVVTLVCIGVFIFPGLVERAYSSWRKKIDDNIPNMLSDVAASVRSGFDLTRAVELASTSDYGPLTEELKAIKIQLSWGLTFEEAVASQMKRVDSQLAKRTFAALMQANKSGGNIQDVLDALQAHATELQQIEKERRGALRPYITTTYISVAIFLGISVVLLDSFFGQIFATQAKAGATGATSIFAGLGGLSLPALKQAFLQMGLVEAVFGGLGAGKLGEASFAAGFKHVIVLAVITVVVFTGLVS